MTDKHLPAFPHPGGAGDSTVQESHLGMTLRDYFAAKFLAGAATDSGPLDVCDTADSADVDAALNAYWAQVAKAAYIAADAMLAARATKTESRS